MHEVRDVRDDARHVAVQDEDGFLVTREFHLHAVDDVDANVSAADAGTLYEATAAIRQIVGDARGIRMCIRDILVDEVDLDACFLRDVERVTDADIVRFESHDSAHDGAVRTVAAART